MHGTAGGTPAPAQPPTSSGSRYPSNTTSSSAPCPWWAADVDGVVLALGAACCCCPREVEPHDQQGRTKGARKAPKAQQQRVTAQISTYHHISEHIIINYGLNCAFKCTIMGCFGDVGRPSKCPPFEPLITVRDAFNRMKAFSRFWRAAEYQMIKSYPPK